MKSVRKIIEINEDLCNGCGECVPSCAEGALKIVDGKARLVSDVYCDGLGACLGGCPTGALKVVEREADAFDEEVVQKYLKEKEETEKKAVPLACGCPSTHIQTFAATPCEQANRPVSQVQSTSALSHWPVQIRLVPPTAPFLKGANLLVAADCTPVAYPDFHGDFLKDKVVMIGCPKFDDAEAYIQKFADIFRTAEIKSVTVIVMEVPCCSKLPVIVKRGLAVSGKSIPVEEIVISTRGYVINRQKIAV